MTSGVKLLVSVRNADEARAALGNGVDVIDVKEPSRGPMGRADSEVITSVKACVGQGTTSIGTVSVSAALGELVEPAPLDLPRTLHYVKIGLAHAPRNWESRLHERFFALRPAQCIAVAYADHERVEAPPVPAVLAWASRLRGLAAGVLIDTAVKDGHTLFDWTGPRTVRGWIERVRADGLLIALAGSLKGQDFEQAVKLNPDIVAVRGAACVGGARQQKINAERVRALSDVVHARSFSTDTDAAGPSAN